MCLNKNGGLNALGSGQGSAADTGKHCNEPSGFINTGNLLEYMSVFPSKEGLYSMSWN
jgi:hypothetical protein